MPSEIRYIAFSRAELAEAFSIPDVRRFSNLGFGDILDVQPRYEKRRVSCVVRVNGLPPCSHMISAPKIAAAIVLLCKAKSIPVPKSCSKTISLRGDNVILRVNIGAFPSDHRHDMAAASGAVAILDAGLARPRAGNSNPEGAANARALLALASADLGQFPRACREAKAVPPLAQKELLDGVSQILALPECRGA